MNLKVYLFGSLLLLVLVAASCSGAPSTPAGEPDQDVNSGVASENVASESKESAGMTDEEFDAFVEAANAELEAKQDQLGEEYGMGSFSRWHFDQATAKLTFFDEKDQLALEADVIDIGSYATKSNTWMWAWGNESVLPDLRKKSEKLKELEALTGVGIFGEEHAFSIEDEATAWELTAVAVKHLGAMGCYRAPSSTGGPQSFLAITRIERVAGGAPN
jgi:hypothetical protein